MGCVRLNSQKESVGRGGYLEVLFGFLPDGIEWRWCAFSLGTGCETKYGHQGALTKDRQIIRKYSHIFLFLGACYGLA